MNRLDTYYRIFLNNKKAIEENRECSLLKKTIIDAFGSDEKIELTRTICSIDETWVNEIEKGIEFIDKAIKEERQFIRSNGEVVPIEKVKNVSRDSVEHLAKHSNLVTRDFKDSDVVPDQLYSVERLSDFAVYENRFLYMLLCYLRDFISIRYNKILELSNTYESNLDVEKVISSNRRRVSYKLKINEIKKDDEITKENNSSKGIIDRIDLTLKSVMLFLQTPLMEQVSKSPMIKPPITKTNVLKMNNNFKGAVALYDFVSSYNSDGFTIERRVTKISPFSDDLKGEFADTIELQTFLMYEYSLKLKEMLKRSFDIEETKRKEEDRIRQVEQLKTLSRRVKESGQGMEEYMLMLEKRNRVLESGEAKLAIANQEIINLKSNVNDLTLHVENLKQEIENKNLELAKLIKEHQEEIEKINAENELKIEQVNQLCDKKIEEINVEHENVLQELREERKEALAKSSEKIEELIRISNEEKSKSEQLLNETRDQCNSIVNETKNNADERIKQALSKSNEELMAVKQNAEKRVSEAERLSEDATGELKRLKTKFKEMKEEKTINDARLNALRQKLGLTAELKDFSSYEAFTELESQYKAFQKLFDGEWKKTKKEIRKNVFRKVKEQDVEEKNQQRLEKEQKRLAKANKVEAVNESQSTEVKTDSLTFENEFDDGLETNTNETTAVNFDNESNGENK